MLRVEIESAKVDAEFDNMIQEFRRAVNLPGFRPGKAPTPVVLRTYRPKIESEVRNKLLSEAFREAVKQEALTVVASPDIEEVQFGRNQDFVFTAVVEIAPEFELPEYKQIPVTVEAGSVTDEDVEKGIQVLLDQRADYKNVDRAAQTGDVLVVNYSGTSDGRPLAEIDEEAKGLAEKKETWIEIKDGSFVPGFTEQLIGAAKGEHRTVQLTFPDDFFLATLASKPAVFEVDIVEVKERVIPELNDEFAVSMGAENLEALRNGVRSDLANELEYKRKRTVRSKLIESLLSRTQCELPESIVAAETKSVVYDIVQENQQRGISKEDIDKHKDKIFSAASRSAKDRVKLNFIVNRIANLEGIKVGEREIAQHIAMTAERHQMKPEKLAKQIKERDGFAEISDQILLAKTLEFGEINARIEEVPAAPETAPSGS